MKTNWQYHGFTILKVFVGYIDDGGKQYQYEVYKGGELVNVEKTLGDAKYYCDNEHSI